MTLFCCFWQDVRNEDEFKVSHLPGAIRADPSLSDLHEKYNALSGTGW